MIFNSVIILSLFALAAGQCTFGPTSCQCSEGQAGNMCLRYESGGPGTYQCRSYTCGSGHVCDCSGSEMCDITDCTGVRDVYRPTGSAPTAVDEVVGCDIASAVQCVTVQVTPANIGEACDASTPCVAGAACNCQGICATEINIEVEGLGDDNLSPWMCGVEFGSQTNFFTQRGTWTYTGACTDLYFISTNIAGTTGMTAAVREVGSSTWISTQNDGSGLSGTYLVNATNTDFFTDPAYSFAAWQNVVPHRFLPNKATWAAFNVDTGANTWTSVEADAIAIVGGGPTWYGDTWYRTTLPFC